MTTGHAPSDSGEPTEPGTTGAPELLTFSVIPLREEVRRQVSRTPSTLVGAGPATLPRRSLLSRRLWTRPAAAAVAAVALAGAAWWWFGNDSGVQAHTSSAA